MASITVGPGGLAVVGPLGEPDCCPNDGLVQPNPLFLLPERLTELYFRGLEAVQYEELGNINDHMPFRASTSQRVSNTKSFKIGMGFDGLENKGGLIDLTPAPTAFNMTQHFLDSCGKPISKTAEARDNANAWACRPCFDGPLPYIGMEETSRAPFMLTGMIPPICTQDFVDKFQGTFYQVFNAMVRTIIDGTLRRWNAEQIKWMVSKARYLAAPVQVPSGEGTVRLTEQFTSYGFGNVPTHYGSPQWIANMIRKSEIPQSADVTVRIPAGILMKYKEHLYRTLGMSSMDSIGDFSQRMGQFIVRHYNDQLSYIDPLTGRTIRFVVDRNPVYVEVVPTGPHSAEWFFQEKYTVRDSELANNVMPRENPNYGVACSCSGRILSALILVTVDNGPKPFYKEPLPDNNPDAAVKEVIQRYGGGKVNVTMRDVYPSSLEVRLLTGIEAQTYLIRPLNDKYKAAGWDCDRFSNLEDVYVGGYVKVASVFVENEPRQLLAFLLAMPNLNDNCVETMPACTTTPSVPTINMAPGTLPDQPPPTLPGPPTPATPPPGAVRPVSPLVSAQAPCTGTSVVRVSVVHEGDTAVAKTITATLTPSTHITRVRLADQTPAAAWGTSAAVTFAIGETGFKDIEVELTAWACPADATAPTVENATIAYTGNLPVEDLAASPPIYAPFTSSTVCLHCAHCPTGPCPDVADCASCG